jgi:hypothetical protein
MKRNITILCAAVFAASTFVGLASTATAALVPPIVNTSPPQIFGEARVGETLVASRGGWRGTYGSTPSTRVHFSYQWFAVEADSFAYPIYGATKQTFTPTGESDVQITRRIYVQVTATRGFDESGVSSRSANTAPLKRGFVTAGTVVVSGKNQAAETLTVSHSNWAPEPLEYRVAWYVDNVLVDGCTFISTGDIHGSATHDSLCAEGATAEDPHQYTPTPLDVGKQIVVVVGGSRPYTHLIATRRAFAGYTKPGQLN